MKTLRPICLLLAGISLLVVMVCGMTLYAMYVGEPSVRYQPSSAQDVMTRLSAARDVDAARDICLPLVQVYNTQTNTIREFSGLRRVGLTAILCWAVLSAIMFCWVFAVLRSIDQTPSPT